MILLSSFQPRHWFVRCERATQWLFPALATEGVENEVLRRQIFVSVLCFVVAPVMIFFAKLEYGGRDWFMAPLLLSCSVVLIVVFSLIRQRHAELILSRFALACISTVALVPVLLDRGAHQLFYLLLVPLIAVFVFGLKEGAIWGACVLIGMIALTAPDFGPNLSSLESARLDFVSAYMIMFVFSLGYEALTLRTQTIADERNTNLLDEQVRLNQAQHHLQQSKEKFRRYSELASDWFFELDADLRLTYVSPRFEELTGIRTARVVGRCINHLIDEYDDCDIEMFKRTLQQRKPYRDIRYSFKTARRGQVYVLTRGEPTFDGHGNFKGYFGTSTNITEYERFQKEIRSKDRTLHHVQKLNAVGQLTSGIAHEFNNLLTVVMGNLEILKCQASNHFDAQILNAIATATNQAADLTSNLLAFSRQQPLESDTLDLKSMLQEFTQLIRPSIGESIDLNVITTPDLMACKADRSQLESAILNLALNGRDAMSGKGKLTILAKNVPAETGSKQGDYIKISVIDEGRGIPADHLDKVTEPFFTTKPNGEGTGLGLSMVYEFVTQSGGKLEIESVEGIGTNVSMILPQSSQVKTPVTRISSSQPSPASGGMKVLVVEDEINVQKIVKRILTMLGHETTVHTTAEGALAVINDLRPDILISDITLGTGMDGIELADHVRSSHPDIKIVLMSGYPEEFLADRTELDNRYKLLVKPFGFNDISNILTNLTA